MLSRTAANLYWTGRYIERADFLARLLDATARLSSLPTTYGGDPTAWSGALAAAGVADAFAAAHGEVTEGAVVAFLTVEASNPSAICNCIERARSNARAVRTGLTRPAWEALNSAWHEVQRLRIQDLSKADVSEFTEAVQRAVAVFD
ncbi:MAG TPA: alpha-E domain-containing protein, partial [Phenylobacterium sp.]|uniref:alpha-E domain-containing protein n=1 Tax=Phenylobacterium sp. TaxID=1871053 RepID=UPI002B47EBD1